MHGTMLEIRNFFIILCSVFAVRCLRSLRYLYISVDADLRNTKRKKYGPVIFIEVRKEIDIPILSQNKKQTLTSYSLVFPTST